MSSETLLTNRDFYLAVVALATEHRGSQRSLENYLCALLRAFEPHGGRDALSLGEVLGLLRDGFEADPAPFNDAWRFQQRKDDGETEDYASWQERLVEQIVDLREMDEAGLLANEYRYFGITAPSGASWYNFDPCAYLECAADGAFGGWEPEDGTGRQYVSGPVAVLNAQGGLDVRNPDEIARPVISIPVLSWRMLGRLLWAGQYYE